MASRDFTKIGSPRDDRRPRGARSADVLEGSWSQETSTQTMDGTGDILKSESPINDTPASPL